MRFASPLLSTLAAGFIDTPMHAPETHGFLDGIAKRVGLVGEAGKCRCDLGERFLEERGTGSNGSAFIGLWSRDAATGRYRAHYFMAPTGEVVVLSHEWRESSQSFVGSAELGGGVRMLAEDRFYGADEYEWTITVQDSAGKVLTRMRGHERRVT